LPAAELRTMPTKPKLTYTLTLTYAEAEALRQFCLRARGAWKIKRESEGSGLASAD